MTDQADDNIPVLRDLVRPGRTKTASRAGIGDADGGPSSGLSKAEIEAIAARVIERHVAAMERSVERAIRKAQEFRRRGDASDTDTDGQ